MSPDLIASTAGLLLSLLISYIPGIAPWYDALTPTPKRLLMLALLFLAALGTLLWQCRAGGAACLGIEWEKYLSAFIHAVVANQAMATITPLSSERRAKRAEAAQRTQLERLTRSMRPD